MLLPWLDPVLTPLCLSWLYVRMAATSRAAQLRRVDLNGNSAGANGTTALADAVARNPRLQVLSIHANAIPSQGADALHQALRQGRAVNEVRGLHHNDVPAPRAAAIEHAAARNRDAHVRGGRAPIEGPASERKGNDNAPPSGRDALDPSLS